MTGCVLSVLPTIPYAIGESEVSDTTREEIAAFCNSPRALAIARFNTADRHAEEIVQDVAIIALEHSDELATHPNLVGWLTLVLKRHCWARNRRDKICPLSKFAPMGFHGEHEAASKAFNGDVEARSGEEDLDDHIEARIALERLSEALGEVKPQERTAILDLAAGYSYKEICARTGWTYTKVNRCITEGKAALRAAMATA